MFTISQLASIHLSTSTRPHRSPKQFSTTTTMSCCRQGITARNLSRPRSLRRKTRTCLPTSRSSWPKKRLKSNRSCRWRTGKRKNCWLSEHRYEALIPAYSFQQIRLFFQDKKATRRVNVMLKRTKSANQSVLEEAVDKTHTAVTRAGPEQPDEDDYGYVSQEASALYEKMMQKYSEIPEEPKFNLLKKKVSTNLSSTKDRVKAALDKEKEDAMQPRKRKRRKHQEGAEDDNEQKGDHDRDSPVAKILSKPKPRVPAPPPLSFQGRTQIGKTFRCTIRFLLQNCFK